MHLSITDSTGIFKKATTELISDFNSHLRETNFCKVLKKKCGKVSLGINASNSGFVIRSKKSNIYLQIMSKLNIVTL